MLNVYMNKRTEPVKILVHLDMRHTASRDMVGGVLRFAAAHRDVTVQFSLADELAAYRAWKPDGLIVDAGCERYPAKEFAALAGRCTVYVNTSPRADGSHPYATITTDERLLAVAAAKLMLGKRLNNFAFVGMPTDVPWSEARGRLFRAELKDRGKPLIEFKSPAETGWRAQERALAAWLSELPKPCGIWAANDLRAKQVLDACRLVGIKVPEQVQVLGVDDERYICEQTIPSLSSLAPDFDAGGFAAAEYLYETLTSTKRRNEHAALKFELKGAVERLSTADVNGTARRVAAAREYIRQHATAGISVPDVVASVGVSRRLLEKNYRAVTGRTILDELQDVRLEKVKDLLRNTTMPIGNIGAFCGFSSSVYLKTLFKKTFGTTMSAYRKGR